MAIFDSRDQYLAFVNIMYGDTDNLRNNNSEYKFQLNLMLQIYAIWMFRIYHLCLLSIMISSIIIPIFGYQTIYITIIMGLVFTKMFLAQKCKNIKTMLDRYD